VTLFMRKTALRDAGLLPKGGILRLYGCAKVHKSGPVYDEVWKRLIERRRRTIRTRKATPSSWRSSVPRISPASRWLDERPGGQQVRSYARRRRGCTTTAFSG